MTQFQRILLFVLAFSICALSALGQRTDVPKDAIQVRIELEKGKFHVGEAIVAKVIISNIGRHPLLIPNQVSSSGASHALLTIQVKNQSGKIVAPTRGWSDDCSEYKPTKLLYESVMNDYLLLRPEASYVLQTELDALYTGFFNDLKPGTYHVKSSYSAGFSPLGCQEWTKEDVEKFPFQAWQGETQLNNISFTILPSPKR